MIRLSLKTLMITFSAKQKTGLCSQIWRPGPHPYARACAHPPVAARIVADKTTHSSSAVINRQWETFFKCQNIFQNQVLLCSVHKVVAMKIVRSDIGQPKCHSDVVFLTLGLALSFWLHPQLLGLFPTSWASLRGSWSIWSSGTPTLSTWASARASVLCTRQHCRLTICMELVKLTNNETAATTPLGGGARKVLAK